MSASGSAGDAGITFRVSASELRLINCSFSPDPYVRVFKKLAVFSDKIHLPGGAWSPYRCPIYRTSPQPKTRSPLWDDVFIPQEHLTSVDGSPAEFIVEAWDYQKYGKDRLIGRTLLSSEQIILGEASIPPRPPSSPTSRMPADVFYMIIGCGLAKKAGTIHMKVADKPASAGGGGARLVEALRRRRADPQE